MSRVRSLVGRRGTWIIALAVAVVAGGVIAYISRSGGAPAWDGRTLESIASDCSRAVDSEINRYLASVPDGATVRFKRKGCYRQTDSIWVRNRNNIVLDGNGATFAFDTTTDVTKPHRSNWRIRRGSAITLKNMTVRGACKKNQCRNGTVPPEKDGYGQHGINLESTASPTLDRVHIRDVLSDGISAEGTLDPKCCWMGPATKDLVLRNSRIERVGRMVVGITNLDGGLIERNVLQNGPMAGIDIEVDTVKFMGRNIQIIANRFDNIHANIIANGGLGSDPEVSNITIERNVMISRSKACGGGIYLRAPGPNPKSYRSGYKIRDNTFKLIGWMVQAERIRDLEIEGNTTDHKPVGCGEKAAIELIDSHSVKIADNDLRRYPKAVHRDAASSGVSRRP